MHFDGWLINIENVVDPIYLDRLEWFLRKLRRDLRDKVHNCTQVIWYDSVVNSGKLNWQNELNNDNMRWFSAVDGFYTNYGWTESHLQRTLEHFYKNFSNEKSPFDIYIGIDVFGRDCIGGWECFKPLEAIRRYNFSAAIFAPGWICETCPIRDQKISLFDNSQRFWNLLKPYLFPHKLTSKQFCTNFSIGFSSECLDFYCKNKTISKLEMSHFCMKNVNIQPFYLSSPAFSKDLKPGILINGCGMFNLFLCNILIEQTDRYLELSYKSSFPVEFVFEVTNGLKTKHLLAKTKERCYLLVEGTSSNFSSEQHQLREEQKQSVKKEFQVPIIIEKQLELNLQQKSGWYIKKIILWAKDTNFEQKGKLLEKRLFNFEMNLN